MQLLVGGMADNLSYVTRIIIRQFMLCLIFIFDLLKEIFVNQFEFVF